MNYYLSKGITIESKMADTEGSTAIALEKILQVLQVGNNNMLLDVGMSWY